MARFGQLTVLLLLGIWTANVNSAAFDSSVKTNTPLNILSITPTGEDVPTGQQIVINFNVDMVPVGEMARSSDKLPITITPELPCQWRWINRRSIACQLSPNEALKPATRYQLVIGAEFASESGNALSKQRIHSFTTERPRPTYAYFRNWASPTTPEIMLTFNLPVRGIDVAKLLVIEHDGRELAVVVREDPNVTRARERQNQSALSNEDTPAVLGIVHDGDQQLIFNSTSHNDAQILSRAQLNWQVAPAEPLPSDARVRLRIKPGLPSEAGPEPSIEDRVVIEFDTFPPFRFLGTSCVTNNHGYVTLAASDPPNAKCDPLRQPQLRFSAPVTKESVVKALEATPSIRQTDDADPWANVYVYHHLSQPHRRGQEYTMALPEGLRANTQYELFAKAEQVRDTFDRPLSEDIKHVFLNDHRRPSMEFVGPISVLEKAVPTHAPLVITNVSDATFRYRQLFSNEATGPLTHVLPFDKAQDIAYFVPFKTREFLGERSGVLLGDWRSTPATPTQSFRNHSNWFLSQVTPFQVHLKLGHYRSLAWVTDMTTGEPVGDATVSVVRHDLNELPLDPERKSMAVTGADGIAMFEGLQEIDPQLDEFYYRSYNGPLLWLRVVKGDDIAVLPILYDFRVEPHSDSGYVYSATRKIHGHLRSWGFTAQGVYRAGDMMQYKIFVRNADNKTLSPPPSSVYSLEIIDPTGKVVDTQKNITLSPFGTFSGDFSIPQSAAVGWYRFQLRADFTDFTWQPLQVLVSDFTPAPFRVSSSLNGQLFRPGDTLSVETEAKLHAGGPYVDAPTKLYVSLDPTPIRPTSPSAQRFYFQSDYGVSRQTIHENVGKIDKQGAWSDEITLHDNAVTYGRITAESVVADDRGKSVAGRANATYVGRDRFVGVQHEGWLLESGKETVLETLVVDEQGSVVADAPIAVHIDYYETVAARVKGPGNAFIVQYTNTWKPAAHCESKSAIEPAACRFTPTEPGSYRFTASVVDSKKREHKSSLQRWAIGKGEVMWPSAPGYDLSVLSEKTEYSVGETAKFLVRNPFPGGRALITVERYGVQQQWSQVFEDATAVIEVPVTKDAIPGFFVSVVVTSPRVETPPDARDDADQNVDLGKPAFRLGYAQISVVDPAKTLRIMVNPEVPTYKPRENVRVALGVDRPDGAPANAELAVVVLDEAVFDLIAQGRDYFDPYKGLYTLDGLDVANFNLLRQLVGQRKFEKKGASAGGDGGASPDFRNIFKYVAYWNPDVALDGNGRAEVEFPAPDNLTGWRVLAIAASREDMLGLGEGTFKVNRPTEIRPALPNQVLEGDHFESRFTVMNRSEQSRSILVTIEVSGAVGGGTSTHHESSLVIAPFTRAMVTVPVEAAGAGDVKFAVTAGDSVDTDRVRVSVPVHRKLTFITAANYGTTTQPQVREDIAIPAEIREDVGEVQISLSPSVIGGLTGAFRYLRDYPYMCWEQKLTKGVMASHFSALRNYLPQEFSWPEAQTLPNETLKLAASHQAPNGGMTYFVAKNEYVDPYLSAYTAIAFQWLHEAGHSVPESVQKRLDEYLKNILRHDAFPSFYDEGMGSTVRAVALAALAQRGTIDRNEVLRYQRHVPQMSLFGRSHYLKALTAVGADAQDQRAVVDNLRSHTHQSGGKIVVNESQDFAYQRILASPLRSQCAMVDALLSHEDQGAASDWPFRMVKTITDSRKQSDRWENTQENMFCMAALVNYAKRYERDVPSMKLTVRAKNELLGELRISDLRDPTQYLTRAIGKGDGGRRLDLTIDRTGSGRYYYGTQLRYAYKNPAEDSINAGMTVHREYHVQRDGAWEQLVTPMRVLSGELVRVDLYVDLPTARNFVVVDDPVPGGFEPVNRDLATTAQHEADLAGEQFAGGSYWHRYRDWREYGIDFWSFYHRELRHDSARFYSEYLPPGRYHLSYMTQAIAPGEYQILPPHSEEMYHPDIFGKGTPARLIVEARETP